MLSRRTFFKRMSQALCGVALAAHFDFANLVPISTFAEKPPVTFAWVKELIQGYKARIGHYPARLYLTAEEWSSLTQPDLPWLVYNFDHGNLDEQARGRLSKGEPFWMEMKPVTHDAEWNPEIYGLNVVSPAIQADAESIKMLIVANRMSNPLHARCKLTS